MSNFPATVDDWFDDVDGWWAKPDSPERRAALGHQYDWSAPGYCTCGRWQHTSTAGRRRSGRVDPDPDPAAPAVSTWRRLPA